MITIHKLVADSIVITTGPVDDVKTRVKYTASSGIQDWEGDIVGEIYGASESAPTSQIPHITDATSITIGSHVTSIGVDAFYECTGLTSVTIPDSVTSIGYEAFYRCYGLTSVTIPDSVTNIAKEAFYKCWNVTDVYCHPNPANLTWDDGGQDDFDEDSPPQCHVKAEYLSAYQAKFGSTVNVTFVGDLT